MMAIHDKNMKSMATLMSGISIYDKGGVPLFSQAESHAELNTEVIQGGFLSVISTFAKHKMGFTSVKFESEHEGTYVIKANSKFIGALHWTADLGLSIEACSNIIDNLLEYLESNIVNIDPDVVSYSCKRFSRTLF